LWHAKKKVILGDEEIGKGILEGFLECEIDRNAPAKDGNMPAQFIPHSFEYSFGPGLEPDNDPIHEQSL
jgi:hypothetical protein